MAMRREFLSLTDAAQNLTHHLFGWAGAILLAVPFHGSPKGVEGRWTNEMIVTKTY